MKTLLSFLFVALIPVASFAWIPQMYFQVNPHYAQVQVVNPTPYPAFCQGYVYGLTQAGFTMNSWFSSYVMPYGYQFAYVYANGPYAFVSAWANIHCY